ncbi:MAG: diguanylate cyclase [Alphaproteobacteria bacterium]|nr:diguanylate cyclase [Alphaproteobacteria bacterium]
MSEEKPEKLSHRGLSRRGFLRAGAGAAGAVATGGVSAAASAGAVAKAGAVSLPSFKILESLVSAVRRMDTIIGETSNINIDDLRTSLKGQLVLPRFPASDNEYQNEIQKGRIDFSSHKELLNTLKSMPSDRPISELLSDTVLQESCARGREDFNTHPDVIKAIKLREIIGPLCDDQTTPADLVEGFKGYFVKLAEYAIQKPQDFIIVSDSSPIVITEDDVRCSTNHINDVMNILKSYGRDDEETSSLLERLQEVNKKWESTNKAEYFQKRLEKQQKRWDEEAAAERKREAEYRKKETQEEAEHQERMEERKASPSKRSKHAVTLQHISGEKYSISGKGLTTQVDWHQWAQSISPETKPHHVSLEEDGRTIVIKNIPENAGILRELFRESQGDGKFCAKLPNRRTGVDLNQSHPLEETPISLPYAQPETCVQLNTESCVVSAREILEGKTILNIDFSRASNPSMKDALTGLNNIAGIKEELEKKGRAVGGYNNEGDQVTLVRFDIKDFKFFNDDYGHVAGDIILQEIAGRISNAAEYETVMGRVGGKKIVMIYYGDRKSVDDVTSDILQQINKSAPVIIVNPKGEIEPIGVTASRKETQIVQFAPRKLSQGPAISMAA